MILRQILFSLLLFPMFSLQAQAQKSSDKPVTLASTHRFALVVGANDGGAERSRLRHAGRDARTLAKVLSDFGGVEASDTIHLVDPSISELRNGFDRLNRHVLASRKSGEHIQFLFYYSGHSDEAGLLVAEQRFAYSELRKMIDSVTADVRIGILDSCASGAFTQIKGGRRKMAFLAGGTHEVKGHAFLTSSSADEEAQESDRIGGSFFTHALVTGLRGAADTNSDKLVTLNEAYRFAFDETRARTEATLGGAQHPSYDIRLAGTGDLVMTDLREHSASLELEAELVGRVYVRNQENHLVAEFVKSKSSGPITLALEPGYYKITIEEGTSLWQADLNVREGDQSKLGPGKLRQVPREVTVARGNTSSDESSTSSEAESETLESEPADSVAYRTIPFNIGIVPPLSLNAIEKEKRITNHFSFNLITSTSDRLEGLSLAMVNTIARDHMQGLQLSMVTNLSRGVGRGAQVTMAANVAMNNFDGLQLATGVNVAMGSLHGAQVATGVNYTKGRLRGLQASSGFNGAREVQGLQVGAINLMDAGHGGQVGFINIAKKDLKGVQFGFVNVARSVPASFGLVTYTKEEGVKWDIWTSDVAMFNVGARFRARYTHSILFAGLHPTSSGSLESVFGLGFGIHAPVARNLSLELDFLSGIAHTSSKPSSGRLLPASLATVRLTLNYRIAKRFAIWGGPTFNGLFDFESPESPRRPGYRWTSYKYVEPDVGIRLWPGFAIGLQI